MRYEGYTTQQRVDDILDKISKYGIESITKLEKEFLDSYKSGNEEDLHKILTKEESEKTFEDDNGLFKFELESITKDENEIHYNGVIICPDLKVGNKLINGRLTGTIIYLDQTGMVIPDFSYEINGEIYDVFDFCEGVEYEFDKFIDYVASELENRN